jgi:ATP-binding cassette subfamily F protein 3
MERLSAPAATRRMGLRLQAGRTGREVLRTRGLEVGWKELLLGVPDLLVERGSRVAILGANASGKSSLLQALRIGAAGGRGAPLLRGEVRWGAGVSLGWYGQDLEQLAERGPATLLDIILRSSDLTVEQARGWLGRFLFSGDEVFKRADQLSGGERARLALAALALGRDTVLLLDEPTNHLDIPAREALEAALDEFAGTVFFVSHDRYFVDRLATELWWLRAPTRTLERAWGNYTAWKQAGDAQRQLEPATAADGAVPAPSPSSRAGVQRPGTGALRPVPAPRLSKDQRERRRRERERLEDEISRLERRLEALGHELSLPATYADHVQAAELGRDYQRLDESLQALYRRWEALEDV